MNIVSKLINLKSIKPSIFAFHGRINPIASRQVFKQNVIFTKSSSTTSDTTDELAGGVKPIILPIENGFYRCSVNNPLEHSENHLNKFYRIYENDIINLDPFKESLRKEQYEIANAFGELSLMVRKPAVEIINYLREIDLSLPAYRFVLYGNETGTGKRSTLLHLLHYAYKDKWLIIHLPHCGNVLRRADQSQISLYKSDRLDTPLEANAFLKRFLVQNAQLLKTLNLKTTKEYAWSNSDKSPAGTPLLDIINYGTDRVKYSSDIVGALIREIKLQATNKKFKVFVGIQQLNSYFGPTRLIRPDKSEVSADQVTIVRSFKKLLKSDWTNAVIVGTICDIGVIIPAPSRRKKLYSTTIPFAQRRRVSSTLHYEGRLTPISLLKKEGFEYLEPFVPIIVSPYTNEELRSYHDYYSDKNWLTHPNSVTDEGREELSFLSGKNPYEFMRVCQSI